MNRGTTQRHNTITYSVVTSSSRNELTVIICVTSFYMYVYLYFYYNLTFFQTHSQHTTSSCVLKRCTLSPLQFPKAAEMISRVLKTVSPFCNGEILLICHSGHKNILKNPVDSMRALWNSGGAAQECLRIRPQDPNDEVLQHPHVLLYSEMKTWTVTRTRTWHLV